MLESVQQSYSSIQESTKQQMTFGGGVDAQTPSHLVAADKVQTATNIDFSLWPGCARARRGYIPYVTTTYTHRNLFKSYWSDSVYNWSMFSAHTGGTLNGVGRISSTTGTAGTYVAIGTTGAAPCGFGKYMAYVYVAGGPNYYKDDGTNTTQWILQSPGTPVVTINTGTPIIISSATAVPQLSGTLQSTSGSGTNVVSTYNADPNIGVVTLVSTAGFPLNLATNGTFATDTIGVVYANMGFSDPTNIYRVTIDFAIDTVALQLSTNTLTNTITQASSTITVLSTATETSSTGTATAIATATATAVFGTASITSTATVTATIVGIGTATATAVAVAYVLSTQTVAAVAAVITTGFQNYWTGQYLPNNGTNLDSALSSVDSISGGALVYTTGANGSSTAVSPQTIANIQSQLNSDANTPLTQISFAANSPAELAIPKTNFQLVGTSSSTGSGTSSDSWSHITAFRVTVESFVTEQNTVLNTIGMLGDEGHPLTDQNNGYIWYQAYMGTDTNGNVTGLSAVSPPAGPYKCTAANATVVTNGTITGTQAGITNIVTYRQGGLVQVPYAVSTITGTVGTMTDTVSDLNELLMDTPMNINVYGQGNFPADISTMCPDAWYDRMFLANGNILIWSTAGQPSQFPIDSFAQISDYGDPIKGISAWVTGLVIINKNSVYEMNGSVFEGANSNYVIYKSGARKGSIAPNTIIKTPYGIPLFNYDGLSMYIPGAGVESHLEWVTAQIGDAFRGNGISDPASMNGSRIPAINSYSFQAAAAYNEGKLYLAVPTGTNTFNDTIFVLDFATQKCFWYQYQLVNSGGAQFYALLWDFLDNAMYADGQNGFYQIENRASEPSVFTTITGTTTTSSTGSGPIPWSFITKEWSAPTDSLCENLAIEYAGGPIQVLANYDGTTTATLGTLLNTNSGARSWTLLPMSAVVQNSISFGFSSVLSTTNVPIYYPTGVYSLAWDAYPHPEKCYFYQTNYDNNNYEGDKLWDIEYFDIGFLQSNANTGPGDGTGVNSIGTCTTTTFIDGTAVMTNVLKGSSTSNQGRNIFTFAFPSETYGEVAYTVLNAGGTSSGTGTQQLFKLWNHSYQARNEPPRITYWHTDWESMEENICDGWDTDINPLGGTVLGTAFIDNVAIATGTYTGTKRQSFTFNWPVEEYGRTIYVEYNSSSVFKHYKTWYHLRKEPDRWTSYVSERRSEVEQHFDNFECELNCLGNTVLATAYVDNIAVDTYTYTSTGSIGRERFVSAVPAETYGKTVYAQYNSTGRFKFFRDGFNGTKEPDRVNFLQKILEPYPSEQYAKTWIVEINPLGTTTGALYIEGSIVAYGTFTGTIREIFNVGIDDPGVLALQTATAIEARYGNVTGTQLLKHYRTEIEVEPKPYGKNSWAMTFRKIGGASQIDVARFHTLDVEVPPGSPAIITTTWDIDQQPGWATNTFTCTSGRNYIDLVPFPPGGRGRLFQERITSSLPVKIWRSILYEERVGVKGFTTTAVVGKPVT